MAASGVQQHWSFVSFTRDDGTQQVIDVTGVDIDEGGHLLGHAGDDDKCVSVLAHVATNPKIILKSLNVSALRLLPVGTRGVFRATSDDAKAAVGGGISYVVINCVVSGNSTSSPNVKFGDAKLTIFASSPDGKTSPISSSQV